MDRVLRRLGPVAGAALLAPVVAAAAPFWAVSALTRGLSRIPALEPRSTDEPLTEYAPVLGVRARPRLDTWGKAEDVFRVTTDADGWRGPTALEEADVVALGDSFAFGYGVDDRDCFTERCGGLRVKSIASPAHSMVHGVLQLRSVVDRLRATTVVWLVYCGNDLADNLQPNLGPARVPFLRCGRDGRWEIVTEHVSPEPWAFASAPRDNDRLYVEMCTPSSFQDRVFSAADHLVGEAAMICRDAGARLTVLTIPPTSLVRDAASLRRLAPRPDLVETGAADRLLAASCASHGVGFVPLGPELRPRHYWADDMHWNAAGHRVAAAAVRDVCGGHER